LVWVCAWDRIPLLRPADREASGAIDTHRRKIRVDHASIGTRFLHKKSRGGNRKPNVARDSYFSLAVSDTGRAQIVRSVFCRRFGFSAAGISS